MGKAIVAVFSGTGNAARAAGHIIERLRGAGYQASRVDLAAGEAIPALDDEDLLVVCSSTLGFSVPSTVMAALKAAPRSGARVAMACVCGSVMGRRGISGGWSGAASMAALSVLRRRGYRPVGSADVSYPENWTQVSAPAQGADREAMLARGDAEAAAFADRLVRSESGPVEGLFIRRNVITLSVGRLVGAIFRLAARRLLGRLFVADDACTNCGLCAESCPAKAIAMKDGLPAWSAGCSACNRCINLCPAKAIQTSTARLVLVLGLNVAAMAAAPGIARGLLRAVAPGLPAFGLWVNLAGLVLYAAFTALQIGPLDALLRAAERSPALRRFFFAGPTRRFGRYLAPGFRPGRPADKSMDKSTGQPTGR